MQQLNVPLGEHIWNDLRSVQTKLHEFRKHRGGDMNLSSFLFSEFCTLEELELGRITYVKDVVLYEEILIKFISYFLE
jgi:hypothetical protein